MRANSAKQRRWSKAALVSALALAAMISGLVFIQGGAKAGPGDPSFNPTGAVYLESVGNTSGTSGDNDNHINETSMPAEDLQFGRAGAFTPSEFYPELASPESWVEPPLGAVVGKISSDSTVGLFGNACNQAIHAGSLPSTSWDAYYGNPAGNYPQMSDIEMLWASTDTSTTVTWADQFKNDNGNDYPDGLDSWPDFILRVTGPGYTPLRRYWGWARVGNSNVSINMVIFEAGGGGADPSWGPFSATLVNVIGDPGATPLARESTTDYCTPSYNLIYSYGVSEDLEVTPEDESGYVLQANPRCGGTYTFHWHYESMLDADEDGFENYLDTCPYNDNVDNPKVDKGVDNDMIDPACEPTGGETVVCWPGSPYDLLPPAQKALYALDCDVDGFYNSLDTCPLIPNGCNTAECAGIYKWDPSWDRQKDTDADTIGDLCDNHPNSPDGLKLMWDYEQDVEIAGPDCAVDTDGDTVLDVDEIELGSDPNDPESTPEHENWQDSCSDDEDNDLDYYIDDIDGGCAEDTDGDGVSDEGEEDLGSDPENADSTPEHATIGDTCTDGVDNDQDGNKDATDDGCVEFTPTVEGSPTPTVEASPTPTEEASPTPTVEVEICPPVLPGLYYGRVLIDGVPAQSGYEITAWADGLQWSSAFISAGRYAMDVPDFMPTETCFLGGTLTFQLNGMTCAPVDGGDVTWASGINNVDLDCTAPVTPTTPPPPPTTPPPTPTTPPVTPTTLPPTGAGGLSGSDSGLPVWALILASWVALTTVAGLGTLVAVKRR